MKNNIAKVRFTKEEMIGRIYMAVESEKEVMRSNLVEKHEDIVGEKVANMAVEMSCKCLDEVGYELVNHINLISSSEINNKEDIGFYSFILTESRNCNRAVSEAIDDEDMSSNDISDTLMSASVVYKVLQKIVEIYLNDNKVNDEDKIGEALCETLEHNSVVLIQKATDMKRKQLLKNIIGSLV